MYDIFIGGTTMMTAVMFMGMMTIITAAAIVGTIVSIRSIIGSKRNED